jgi:hypothetical protein
MWNVVAVLAIAAVLETTPYTAIHLPAEAAV